MWTAVQSVVFLVRVGSPVVLCSDGCLISIRQSCCFVWEIYKLIVRNFNEV